MEKDVSYYPPDPPALTGKRRKRSVADDLLCSFTGCSSTPVPTSDKCVINLDSGGYGKGASDPISCSQQCKTTSECKRFTWWGDSKQCWLLRMFNPSECKSLTPTVKDRSFSGNPSGRGNYYVNRKCPILTPYHCHLA